MIAKAILMPLSFEFYEILTLQLKLEGEQTNFLTLEGATNEYKKLSRFLLVSEIGTPGVKYRKDFANLTKYTNLNTYSECLDTSMGSINP